MSGMSRRSFLQHSAALATVAGGVAATPAKVVSDVSAQANSPKDLLAGVARVDITPKPGVPMWGYGGFDRLSTGTLDPLYAKCVVMKVGDKAVGLVVTDLGRMPMLVQCNRIREAVKDVGVDDVIFMGTHTHSGPILEDLSMPHTKEIEKGVLECVKKAASNLQPARIGLGRTMIDISHNRRVIINNECIMRWRNEKKLPSSPLDHEAGVIRIDTADGKPLAVLVSYACHAVCFGPDNHQYSADWPGEMCRLVGEKTGALCFFLQGGAGDINPYLDKTPLSEGGVASMRGVGKQAADSVMSVFNDIHTKASDNPSIMYQRKHMDIGCRWNIDDPVTDKIVKKVYGIVYDYYLKPLHDNPGMPLGVLVLNKNLALSFAPGELFVQFQLDLKKQSPLQDTFLCGYANDFFIYFPTIGGAAIGGYGGTGNSIVEVGAGDRLITESTRMIGDMLGKFGPVRDAKRWQYREWDQYLKDQKKKA